VSLVARESEEWGVAMDDMHKDESQDVSVATQDHPLLPAAPARQLSRQEADFPLDLNALDFQTTADLQPLNEIVGQNRAMSALEVGLGIHEKGYNIFAAGLTGSGKMQTIKRSLQRRLDGSKTPDDWVYVHNFNDSDQPWAIRLAPGKGRQLEKDMDRLIQRLREALPKAFRQQDFRDEKEQLSRKYEQQIEEHTDRLTRMAKDRGFEIGFTPGGRVSFLPYVQGKPAETREQLDTLPEADKNRISEGEKELTREVGKLMQEQYQLMQNLSEEIRGIERQFADYVVGPMIEAIKQSYSDNERVVQYLGHVHTHILDNLADFQEGGGAQAVPPQLQAAFGRDAERPLLEYKVNVVVDNGQTKAVPILVEEAPTYRNLFGSIDRTVDRWGRLATDFTQIRAGSLLRANGGYLVFNIEDALTEPFVYKSLKRALKSGCIELESINPWVPFSMGGLRPEPIAINTKVVVVGNPLLYYLLQFYDDEFPNIFKIKADFGQEMPRGENEQMQYARFVAAVTTKERLRPFTRDAVGEIIRFGSRQVADRTNPPVGGGGPDPRGGLLRQHPRLQAGRGRPRGRSAGQPCLSIQPHRREDS
jgi:predicted ATP-dependent protease